MPFWDRRGVWQGLVRWEGRKFKKAFKIKRDAIQWEVETRRELETQLNQKPPTVMALGTFFNRYLDQAKLRFVR